MPDEPTEPFKINSAFDPEREAELIREFLTSLDDFGKQALADCIADGTIHSYVDDRGERIVSFTLEGIIRMERREQELRRSAN